MSETDKTSGAGLVDRMAARSWGQLWGGATGMLTPAMAALLDAQGSCIDDPQCVEPEHLLPPALAYGLVAFAAVMLLLVLAAMARKLAQ